MELRLAEHSPQVLRPRGSIMSEHHCERRARLLPLRPGKRSTRWLGVRPRRRQSPCAAIALAGVLPYVVY